MLDRPPRFPRFSAGDLLERIALRDQEIKSVKIKSLDITEVGGSRTIMVNDGLQVEGAGLGAIGKFIGVPSTFLLSAPLDLSKTILSRMLREIKDEREIVVKGKDIVATRNKETPFQPALPVFEHLFKEALPDIEGGEFIDLGCSFDTRLVTNSLLTEPRVGDMVRGGLRMLYSEIMSPPPLIEGFSERLRCLNGMCHTELHNQHTFRGVEELKKLLTETAQDMAGLFNEQIAPNLAKSTEMKIDGAQAIRRIFKRDRLNPKYLDGVLQAYLSENDDTAYGVMQAFTRAARNLGYSQHNDLQASGGRTLPESNEMHCPACFAVL